MSMLYCAFVACVLKSDHCGIEMIRFVVHQYTAHELKSDHCGIEIIS